MVTAYTPQGSATCHCIVTAEAIVAAVATTFGVSKEFLTGPGRLPEMVDARKVAIRLLARRGLGSTAIGRLIGRDHSTVLHHQHSRLSEDQRIVLVELARELGLPRLPRHTTSDRAAVVPR
jgi:chromosomal replication initiation ATPase DnaA